MFILQQLSTLCTGNACIVREKNYRHTETVHYPDLFLAQTNSPGSITRLILLSSWPFPTIPDKRDHYISLHREKSSFLVYVWRERQSSTVYNYLIDENCTIGVDGSQSNGPNTVISMLHHAFQEYGLGEIACHIHCDNCAGFYYIITHRYAL